MKKKKNIDSKKNEVKNEVKNKEKKVKEKKEKSSKAKDKKGNRIIRFFKQVINELKITVWPDKYYMVKYSIATFATIILCSVYFSLMYLLFTFIKELR